MNKICELLILLIFTVLFSLSVSVSAQEDYYWYGDRKIPLELMPTRKFILLASPDDTLALKNRLTEQNENAEIFICLAYTKYRYGLLGKGYS
jgi:hypothetical protein